MVLLGEHLGRGEQRGLPPGVDHLQHRAEGDERLARSHLALQETVHRVVAAQLVGDQVAAADRILVVTPEYNGTMPAVVNNALDWASRPFGAGAITGKPLAVVGTSVGQHGGKWAHDDTRRSAKVAGASVLDEVELHHRYEWGSDPVADAATVTEFLAAVEKLAAHEGVAA